MEETEVFIVGGGVSAIGAAIRLERDLGITDVVLAERASALGGTWLHNSYPGCACDVPSPIYTYEFEPNPEWDRMFAEQPQILAYVQGVAAKYGVPGKTLLNTEVLSAEWMNGAWHVSSTAGDYRARILIFAAGGLHDPVYPDVPGRESFAGAQFHSSTWDHAHDMSGERVAVVGTGASAVQLIPHVGDRAAHLTVVQRTPTWIWPKPDWKTSRFEKLLYRRVPVTQRALRRAIWWLSDFLLWVYGREKVARLLNSIGRVHLRWKVKDPELRRALTPDWTFGCKRITFSNRFYETLVKPTTTLVPHGLREVRPQSIITDDGAEHEVDTIVWCTGFHVSDPPFADRVRGRSGRTLAEEWGGNPRA